MNEIRVSLTDEEYRVLAYCLHNMLMDIEAVGFPTFREIAKDVESIIKKFDLKELVDHLDFLVTQ